MRKRAIGLVGFTPVVLVACAGRLPSRPARPTARPTPADLAGATVDRSADLWVASRAKGERITLEFLSARGGRAEAVLGTMTIRADGDPVVRGSVDVRLADADGDGATDARIRFELAAGPSEDVPAALDFVRRGPALAPIVPEAFVEATLEATADSPGPRLRAAEAARDAVCADDPAIRSPLLAPPCPPSAALARARFDAAADAARSADAPRAIALLAEATAADAATLADAAHRTADVWRVARLGGAARAQRIAVLPGPLASPRGPLDPRVRWSFLRPPHRRATAVSSEDVDAPTAIDVDLAGGTARYAIATGAAIPARRPVPRPVTISGTTFLAGGTTARCGADGVVVCERQGTCGRCTLQIESLDPGCDPATAPESPSAARLVAISPAGRIFVGLGGRLLSFRLDPSACADGRWVLGVPTETSSGETVLVDTPFDPAARFGLWIGQPGVLYLVESGDNLRSIALSPPPGSPEPWPDLARAEPGALAVSAGGDRAAVVAGGELWTIDLGWSGQTATPPPPPRRATRPARARLRPSAGSAPSLGGTPSPRR